MEFFIGEYVNAVKYPGIDALYPHGTIVDLYTMPVTPTRSQTTLYADVVMSWTRELHTIPVSMLAHTVTHE